MEWRNPRPTVDVIIQVDDCIVLIRRRNPPLGWALPGGFVDEGEKVENAAIREAKEETEMDVVLDELLYVYSDPARDRRFHTLSIVFTAHAQGVPVGADDAAEAKLFSLNDLPNDLAFDHGQILSDYVHFIRTGQRPTPQSLVAT